MPRLSLKDAIKHFILGSSSYFLDILGYTLILVIAAPSLLSPSEDWFILGHFIQNRFAALASILAVYPILQLLSSFVFHPQSLKLSLLCLFSNIIIGFGFLHHDLLLILLGRALGGYCSGNMNGSSAVHNTNDALLMAFAFVIGPALASIIADDAVISIFQSALPFWALAALTLLQIILSSQTKLTPGPPTEHSAPSLRGWLIWCSLSIKDPRRVSFFFFMSSWMIFVQFLSAALVLKFNWTESQIGLVYALIGMSFLVAFILKPTLRLNALMLSMPILAIVMVFFREPILFILCTLVISIISAFIWQQAAFFFAKPLASDMDQISFYFSLATCVSTVVAIAVGAFLIHFDLRHLFLAQALLSTVAAICFFMSPRGFFSTPNRN